MNDLLKVYPVGTRLRVSYYNDTFKGTVTDKDKNGKLLTSKGFLDIIPDKPLGHSRYLNSGVHAVDPVEIREVLSNSFDDSLFEL